MIVQTLSNEKIYITTPISNNIHIVLNILLIIIFYLHIIIEDKGTVLLSCKTIPCKPVQLWLC